MDMYELFKQQYFFSKFTKYKNIEDLAISNVYEWINSFAWADNEEGFEYWNEAYKFWREKVTEIVIEKAETINMGIEWEFWTDRSIPNSILEEYNIIKEYYDNQYEVNKFLYKNLKSKEEVFKALTMTLKYINNIKKILKEEGIKCYISSKAKTIDSSSIVFNGLHIHISINTDMYSSAIYKTLAENNYAVYSKINKLPTLRTLLSHHIWGALRHYNYNYKRKRRFKPVITTQIETVEYRLFDPEDIIYKTRREILADIIWNIPKNVSVKYTYPSITDGENIIELYQLIKKVLEGRDIAKFRILEENEHLAKVKSNYQEMEFDFENNIIKIIKGV